MQQFPHDAGLKSSVPLTEQVADYVRLHIERNGLGPGDPLPGEAEVSRTLGISRSVVREAWSGLIATGVLESAPGRRPRVASLVEAPMRHVIEHGLSTGQASVEQILEFRQGVEIQAVLLAAERRREDEVVALRGQLEKMAQRLHDESAYAAADAAFHGIIAAASRNPFFILVVQACQSAFERSMRDGMAHRVDALELRRVQLIHEQIYEALAAGNAQGAEVAMSAHFQDALTAYRRGLPPPG